MLSVETLVLPDNSDVISYEIHHNHVEASLWRLGETLASTNCFYYDSLGEVFCGLMIDAGYDPDVATMTIDELGLFYYGEEE